MPHFYSISLYRLSICTPAATVPPSIVPIVNLLLIDDQSWCLLNLVAAAPCHTKHFSSSNCQQIHLLLLLPFTIDANIQPKIFAKAINLEAKERNKPDPIGAASKTVLQLEAPPHHHIKSNFTTFFVAVVFVAFRNISYSIPFPIYSNNS